MLQLLIWPATAAPATLLQLGRVTSPALKQQRNLTCNRVLPTACKGGDMQGYNCRVYSYSNKTFTRTHTSDTVTARHNGRATFFNDRLRPTDCNPVAVRMPLTALNNRICCKHYGNSSPFSIGEQMWLCCTSRFTPSGGGILIGLWRC